jgi:hypothetical protein
MFKKHILSAGVIGIILLGGFSGESELGGFVLNSQRT